MLSLAVFVPSAYAGYEWLGPVQGEFAPQGAEGNLGLNGSVAVNNTSGDLYVADGSNHRVTRFTPEGRFIEAWGWGVSNESPQEKAFQRCGEDGEPAHPTCMPGYAGQKVGEHDGVLGAPEAIAVDQSTGDVYVFDEERSNDIIQVFNSDGEFITGFGQAGGSGEPVSANPELIHTPGGIAVDSSGNVFISSTPGPGSVLAKEGRVMIFTPETAGHYEHYVYSGISHDINVGAVVGGVTVDSSDNVYALVAESHVARFAPVNLGTLTWEGIAGCESQSYAELSATTADDFGDVFIFSRGTKKLYRLSTSSCTTLTKMTQIEQITPALGESETNSLAFNPEESLKDEGEAVRPKGTLYATESAFPLTAGLIFGQSPVFPPSVVSESASSVGVTQSTLEANIDTHNNPTRYHFQYIDDATYLANRPNETQTLGVSATAGIFTLEFGGQSTGGAGAVTLTAGSAVATSLVTAAGTANVKSGSKNLTSVATSTGRFFVGQPIAGTNIAAGTTIVAVSASAITLSKPATGTGNGFSISSAGPIPFAVGQAIVGAGIPSNTTIVSIAPGELTLSQAATASATNVEVSSGIRFDASAGEVRSALDGLSSIGDIGGSVSVSGGPGSETGANPYVVTFEGEWTDRNVAQLAADGTQLSGGSHAVTVATTNEGGAGFSTGAVEAPTGGGQLEANGDVAMTVAGLHPGSRYHFRVVGFSHCNPEAPAEECVFEGHDRAFTTFPAEAGVVLPDGRAYELVSPPVKAGGEVFPADPFVLTCRECLPGIDNEHFPMQSTVDGGAIVYEGAAFFAAGGAVNENEYLATRTTGGGWGAVSSDLSPPLQRKGVEQGYMASSADLSHGVLYQIEPALSPQALQKNGVPYANLYLQDTAEPQTLTPLLTAASVSVALHREPGNVLNRLRLRFAGASSDFSRIIFEANDALTPEAPEGNNLYEWAGGQLHLINISPEGTPEASAVFGSGTDLGSVDPDYNHAISADGSRIFWTGANGHSYIRQHGETVKIPDAGKFLTANPNGSKVLLSDGELYEVEADELTDLTNTHGGFKGILGATEDLSKIYFVDTANLTGEEENSQKAVARAGGDNLYMWVNGVPVFIVTLGAGDNGTNVASFLGETGDWSASPSDRTAQASTDGRYLIFMSNEALTGYDNEAVGGDCGSGKNCFEVFEYDAVANKLSCASCNPTGERPIGPSTLGLIKPRSGPLPQPTSVSTSGKVFFNSLDALSPHDRNGEGQDVYEYEPDGGGTCAHGGGCVFLISSGEGKTPAGFVNATPSGGDVFFTTRSQLVLEDQDDLIDLYDAREPHVSGEQVSFPPKVASAECASSGECRPTSSSSPNLMVPLAGTDLGAGNLAPPSPPLASPPVVKPPPPTRAQLLARALKACQRQKTKRSRATCTAKARKRFGAKAKKTRAARTNGSKTGKRTK